MGPCHHAWTFTTLNSFLLVGSLESIIPGTQNVSIIPNVGGGGSVGIKLLYKMLVYHVLINYFGSTWGNERLSYLKKNRWQLKFKNPIIILQSGLIASKLYHDCN